VVDFRALPGEVPVELVLKSAFPAGARSSFFAQELGAASFRVVRVRLGFDEIQNGPQLEKPGPLYLTWFANADASNASIAGEFVKFASAKTAKVIRPSLGRPDPNRQLIIAFLK
jgi:hypothetical protein